MSNLFRRSYALSDAIMLQEAKLKLDIFTEDKAAFILFDAIFTDPFAANWLADIDAAEAVTKDSVIIDQQAQLTELVAGLMKLSRTKIKHMRYFIEKAFPAKKKKWDEFGYNDYRTASRHQAKMIQFLEDLFHRADEYKVELTAAGFTQVMIDEILSIHNQLDAANREQEFFISGRPVMTEDRIIIMNKPWETVKLVCRVGKLIFADDPARYRRYLLPPNEGESESNEITSTVELTTGLDIEVSMNGMLNATAQVLFGDGSSRKMIFDGINLVTVNHTYPSLGTYPLVVRGDLLNTTEFHSNNSQLTTFFIPDDAVNINTYVLQNNKFTTDVVDYILTRVNEFNTVGKLINLAGNGVPSAIGLAAKAALEARGWVVIVAS